MKGSYHIVVQNKRLRYDLNIRRNISVIRGDFQHCWWNIRRIHISNTVKVS